MRAAIVGFTLIAFAGAVCAQLGDHAPDEGRFRVKFPGDPKVTKKTADTRVGELPVTTAVFATADGSVFMVSYTDFPESAKKPEHHATLLDGIRDGVLKSRNGKLVGTEKTIEFGAEKSPGREFTVEAVDKDKTKYRLRFRVVLRDSRLYQVAVIGPAGFTNGKDATAFLESFELTK